MERIISVILIFGGIIGLLIWEGFLLVKGKETVSRSVYEASKLYPILPFMLGLVIGVFAGHFFWSL